MIVGVHEQGGIGAGLAVVPPDLGEIDVEDRVAVEDDEAWPQRRQGLEHRPGGAEGLAFDLVVQGDAKAAAVAKVVFDQLGPVPGEQVDVQKAVSPRQGELVLKDWPPRHAGHGFWNGTGLFGEASAQATREDDELLHRRASSQGFAVSQSTVAMIDSRIVYCGTQPVRCILLTSRKTKGLSPTQPRSPPA